MPPQLDLKRADSCARAAVNRLGRRLPGSYPATPLEAFASLTGNAAAPRRAGIVSRIVEAAENTLRDAAVAELEARAAQELAVEALRACGEQSASWERIGELVGISRQAAHKRYAETSARPRAELTIDDELQTTAATA